MSDKDEYCTYKFSAQIINNIYSDDANDEKNICTISGFKLKFLLTVQSRFFTICIIVESGELYED